MLDLLQSTAQEIPDLPGIYYDMTDITPDGGIFIIYTVRDIPLTDLEKSRAKQYVLDNQDVVSIRFATEDDWLELFKTQIFRLCPDLKWYHINWNYGIAKAYFRNKKTPAAYVEEEVIPKIGETRAKYIQLYGKDIFRK